MLKDDGLAKEISLDKTMLLEAALKHGAAAAACPSLSEVAGFSGEEQRSRGGKSLDFRLYPLYIISLIAMSMLWEKILKGKRKSPSFPPYYELKFSGTVKIFFLRNVSHAGDPGGVLDGFPVLGPSSS